MTRDRVVKVSWIFIPGGEIFVCWKIFCENSYVISLSVMNAMERKSKVENLTTRNSENSRNRILSVPLKWKIKEMKMWKWKEYDPRIFEEEKKSFWIWICRVREIFLFFRKERQKKSRESQLSPSSIDSKLRWCYENGWNNSWARKKRLRLD